MTSTAVRDGMFAEFLDWQDSRSVRKTGAPMALSTRHAKGYRLRSVARILGVDTPMSLAAELGRRESVVRLLDILYTRQTPGTILSTVVAAKHFSEYAEAMGWIGHSQILPDDIPKGGSSRRKPIVVYSADEVEKLLLYARARDLRFWMFLTTLADTGRRVGEILNLEYRYIHLDAQPPHFDLPYTKNKRQALVPLGKRLVEEVFTEAHIGKLQAKAHPLSKKDPLVSPFPWKYNSASDALRALCEAAEVPYHSGFHVFRHTKATALLGRGVPIQAVAALLGHNSVQTTDRIYNHATALSYTQYVE